MKLRILLLAGLTVSLLSPLCLADAANAEVSMEQIMTDPDWIGPPVEQAWWRLDGGQVYYRVKETGGPLRQTHRIDLANNQDTLLALDQQNDVDGANPNYDNPRQRAVFTRNGDIFLRDLRNGDLRQLTRTPANENSPRFSSDGQSVYFQRDRQWWSYRLDESLETPVADLRFSADPDADNEDDLARMQLRLFSTLRNDDRDARRQRQQGRDLAGNDASLPPAPWYLGNEWEPRGTALSPDGRWLLMAMAKAGANPGQSGKMPHFVTASGYVDVEDVRTRVGRNAPTPHTLWLLDLATRTKHEISFDPLPGLKDQPLAFLQTTAQASDKSSRKGKSGKPEATARALTIEGIEWNATGTLAAIQLHAVDNKDRWLATIDPTEAKLAPRHRLSDPGWINWLFNEYGWMPDGETLWFLSEETGYSHFYLLSLDQRRPKALTEGDFEVMDPVVSADGRHVYLLSNRAHPSEYDVYVLDVANRDMRRLTQMQGIESFVLSPRMDRLLLQWSAPYTPSQIAVLDLSDNAVRTLTDTRTAEYRAYQWQDPRIVGVPSQHGVTEPIWSKFYPPRGMHAGKRPIVLFVHGAGYTQNTHRKFPYYFREQMFHNLLTERGYLVLDMDYRASRGYGRDWRTAIYRQMGHPELEDLVDGVRWLVEEHQGDPERVGVYGGSYGGFMSLMAMFRAPETFHAGAALRPVTDWAHYNHEYTSNILNTPESDPEAYLKSSPIEFAEHLRGHLLIAHGMLDDNVFFQDSVRLAQRLIELKKDHWELASYPLEPHSFVHAESWLDEYRRVLRLFETTIGDAARP